MDDAQVRQVRERAEHTHVHDELRAQRQPVSLRAQRRVALAVQDVLQAAGLDVLQRQEARLGARCAVQDDAHKQNNIWVRDAAQQLALLHEHLLQTPKTRHVTY